MGTVAGSGNGMLSWRPVEFKELEGRLCGMFQQTTSGWCREPDIAKQMQKAHT